MEFLQPILGEELFSQVKEKIDAYNGDPAHKDKPCKPVDLSGGGYVSADKYNAAATKAAGYKTQLDTITGELTTLKGKKSTDEGTKAALDALQAKYDTDIAALTGKVTAARFDGALEAALAKSGARNTKALRGAAGREQDHSGRRQPGRAGRAAHRRPAGGGLSVQPHRRLGRQARLRAGGQAVRGGGSVLRQKP